VPVGRVRRVVCCQLREIVSQSDDNDENHIYTYIISTPTAHARLHRGRDPCPTTLKKRGQTAFVVAENERLACVLALGT